MDKDKKPMKRLYNNTGLEIGIVTLLWKNNCTVFWFDCFTLKGLFNRVYDTIAQNLSHL